MKCRYSTIFVQQSRRTLAVVPSAWRTMGTHEYDPSFYPRLFAIEDRHFWFVARNHVIRTLVRQLRLRDGARVLEVGCGTGNSLRPLEEAGGAVTVIGMDRYAEGLHYARTRTRAQLVCADSAALPFSEPFDLVCVFDVLEHLDDDIGALRELRAAVRRNGHLLVTVPACKKLWSRMDELSCHRRRYEKRELLERISSAGFQVEYATAFMSVTYPIMRLSRLRNAESAEAELRVYPVLNSLLRVALAPERLLVRLRRSIPWGSSMLVLALAR